LLLLGVIFNAEIKKKKLEKQLLYRSDFGTQELAGIVWAAFFAG